MTSNNQADSNVPAAQMAAILAQTRPVQNDDPIVKVMHACGFPLDLPSTVRMHPCLPYAPCSGREVVGHYPAVVLPMFTGAGEAAGLEVLYMVGEGVAPVIDPWQDLWVSEARMRGAHFKVAEPAAPGVCAVAVNVMNAIAAWRLTGWGTCAVSSAEDLAAFDWPADTDLLLIMADHTSMDEANALAERAQAAGITADVRMPATPGATFYQELAFAGAMPCDQEAQDKADAASLDDSDDEQQ